jgi:O-6-methylguanine DNA methyltransferase
LLQATQAHSVTARLAEKLLRVTMRGHMAGFGRAGGAANGKNPLPIIVPCHRVLGANGKLVGFGGGLPIKQALLELETKANGTAVARA